MPRQHLEITKRYAAKNVKIRVPGLGLLAMLAVAVAGCGEADVVVAGTEQDAAASVDTAGLDGLVADSGGADAQTGDSPAADVPVLDVAGNDTTAADAAAADSTALDTTAQDGGTGDGTDGTGDGSAGDGLAGDVALPCPDGQPCDDGNPCTEKDTCLGGTCSPGAAKACADDNICTDDSCDPKQGCVNLPNAATCSDGNACTGPDLCKQGKCGGAADSCDDNNPCTDDTCAAATGCAHIPNAAPCVDGNACDLGDQCEAGACKGGKAKDCSDGNPCTADACEPTTGVCSHPPATAPCDDGSQCTAGDACKDGQCAGAPLACDDGNPCTTDNCDKLIGCTAVLNQAQCDDLNACTDFDKCDQGKCKGIAKDAADCDDSNPCTTDTCDKKVGCVATNNAAPCDDGNTCTVGDVCGSGKCASGLNTCDCAADADCAAKEDGNACNGTLFCDKAKGQCVINPKTVVTCPADGNSACAQQKCEPTSGKCALQPISEGNPCDADGTVCTADDKCVSGLCKAGAAVVCDDGNGCTNDSCDPLAGCKNTANTAPCDADGNACTVGDVCVDKACAAGKQKLCDDSNPCTADSCDKASGLCVFAAAAKEGDPCDADGSNCTVGDACKAGACQKGPALNCDDGEVCSVDSCNPQSGCVHLAATGSCDADGDACTVADQCDNKVCLPGAKKNCDDGDLCTTDGCSAATGACSHVAVVGCGGNCAKDPDCDDKNVCTADACTAGKCAYQPAAGACDDGNTCTKGDSCNAGKCGGTSTVCDDGLVCTTDSCDPALGCKFVNNFAACEDGDVCTTGDQCKDGKCGAGLPKICDDGDACTKDTCNPADGSCKFVGIAGCGVFCAKSADCDDKNPCTDESCQGGKCVQSNNTIGCDDGNPCTAGDICASGKCAPGATKNCNDNNVCTGDSCDVSNGLCVNSSLAATATCDDGNACTSPDTCSGVAATGKAACTGKPKNCDDGNACTTDNCVAASGGCTAVNNSAACDDGNPCTPGDLCASGKCIAGTTLAIDTLAGSGNPIWADGTGAAASMQYPLGLVADASGNVYVSDSYNNRIRKVTPGGVTTTLAGNAAPGYTDGKGTQALFNQPWGIAMDAAGNLIIADFNNSVLRKLAPDGTTTTLAGSGAAGFGDGDLNVAKFNHPSGVAVGPGGLVAVTDYYNHRVRLVHPSGVVTTLAGDGVNAFADDPVGTKARFNFPLDVRFAPNGDLYVADQYNHRIRKVTPGGATTTVAGTGIAGFLDGDVSVARLQYPWGLAMGPDGALYIADRYNHRIRKLVGNKLTTWAGTGVAGWQDGPAITGRFQYPAMLSFDAAGYLYVADGHNHRIRRIRDGSAWCQIGSACSTAGWTNPTNSCQICDPGSAQTKWTTLADGGACDDGKLCTAADVCSQGQCAGAATSCDDKDSCTLDACDPATSLCAFKPIVGCGGNCAKATDCDDKNPCTDDACVGAKCVNNNNTLACDDGNPCSLGDICTGGKCLAGNQIVVSTLAGSGTYGYKDGAGSQAQFKRPLGTDVDALGNVYVAEYEGHTIRKIAPDGTVSLVAGSGLPGLNDGKGATAAFQYPTDVKVGPGGKLYVADRFNHRVRVIDTDGSVTTLAGSVAGVLDGPAVSARFNEPIGIAVNAAGVVLVADYANSRIRRIQGGVVTTLAGGVAGFADGKGASAKLNGPLSVALDGAGNGIFVQYNDHRVRKVAPDGTVTTVAGTGIGGYADGAAANAMFQNPWGVAVDGAGNIFVADRSNHRIRKISPSGIVSKVAGTGQAAYKDGFGNVATFSFPSGVAVDAQGQLWVGDDQTQRVRKVVDATNPCLVAKLCYAAGLPNPQNGCQICDATKDPSSWSTAPDGQACSDDKLCTGPDACSGGSCASAAVSCDDKDSCTTDACDAETGACLNKAILGCNGNCAQNSDCDDSNVCTTDSCVAAKCQFVNNTAACDDANVCTVGDICNNGACVAGALTWIDTAAGAVQGYKDATGTAASFNTPLGVDALDDGTAWVADTSNNRIRKIAADGTVTTFAGSGNAGFLDAKGVFAWFSAPVDIDHDAVGNLYVVDRDNHALRKIAPDGTVTAIAGSGAAGLTDDKGAKAKFNTPYSIAVTPAGISYVADYGNHRIRKVLPTGEVTTLAGSVQGYADGTGAAAKFIQPVGVGLDRQGNLYVAEYSGHRIRKVTPDGVVTSIAGTGVAGLLDGDPALARFQYPWGIAVSGAGTIYVADRYNQRIRRIEGGIVSTWAGSGAAGFKDGAALQGAFNYPLNVALTSSGYLWVADGSNHRVRRVRETADSCAFAAGCWTNGYDNPSQTCQVCAGAKSATKWSVKADTASCSDGDYCTTLDTCGSGKCSGSAACDDANACTLDACDGNTGACSHAAIANCP